MQRKKPKDEEQEGNNYHEVNPIKAFEMLINQSLKSFHTMLSVRLQKFRDEELWHHPVQQVLSNNEVGLRVLFDMYSQRKEKYLTPDDVIKMIYEDAELDLAIE